ncbi:hypothetical protein FA95DRAFT_1002741 [Auriscalpium vulgare]|uniref:Uncharacterized protein n=1 Tax=Auriscalpium vulgare TaxID=40419 RepID=A0ACB8R6W7_9AGAM|nr:hypothetical protein FA95DRAFT_1002741 [Auriscalpium vulgare]
MPIQSSFATNSSALVRACRAVWGSPSLRDGVGQIFRTTRGRGRGAPPPPPASLLLNLIIPVRGPGPLLSIRRQEWTPAGMQWGASCGAVRRGMGGQRGSAMFAKTPCPARSISTVGDSEIGRVASITRSNTPCPAPCIYCVVDGNRYIQSQHGRSPRTRHEY